MDLKQPFYIEKRQGDSHLDLSGSWSFAYLDVPTDEPDEINYSMSCRLPASTYCNVYEAGLLPDPYFGENSHQYAWLDTKVWYYTREFELARALDAKSEDAFLCFDGVGYYSRVWLNGELLGEHDGMFGGPVVNVAGRLKKGANRLTVEVKAFNYGKEGDIRFWRGYLPTGWRNKVPEIVPWNTSRDEESSNGDFHVFGIWNGIRLEIMPKLHVARPYLYTKSLEGSSAELEFELSIATDKIDELSCILSAAEWNYTFSYFDGLSGALSDDTVRINVEITDRQSGEKIYSEAEDYTLYDYEKNGINEKFRECQYYRRSIKLDDIRLWYPQTLGEQNLYDVTVTLEKDGVLLDTLGFATGIRKIERFESTGRKYRQRWDRYWFSVNGKKIFLKAMNWIPLDYLFNISREDYRWALEQVKNCGIQLLRVWAGGGMPEDDYFYQLCDEMGIMVWQDTFMANQIVGKWQEATLEAQLCYNIFRIRNHPSLIVYCGGNEFPPCSAGNNAALFVIQRNVEDLDPSRIFFRTTPDKGSYHGYRNMDAAWIRKIFKELPFMAESGTHCFPNYKSICQNIAEDEWKKKFQLDSDNLEEEMPGFSNHLTEYKKNRCLILRSRMSRFIDLNNSSLKDYCEGSGVAASEYYQFLIQSLRENYPKSVGVMLWALKRGWTTVAVQMIDGMGEPVAPYYTVKQAYSQKMGFASVNEILYAPGEEVSIDIKAINDSDSAFNGTVVAELYDPALSKVTERSADITLDPADYMMTAFSLNFKVEENWANSHFYIRVRLIENGETVNTSFYPLVAPAFMADKERREEYRKAPSENIIFDDINFMKEELGKTTAHLSAEVLSVSVQGERTTLRFKVKTDAPTYPVMLEIAEEKTLSYQSDNYFFLGEGEEKVIDMEVRNIGDADRSFTLKISSWNSEDLLIKL